MARHRLGLREWLRRDLAKTRGVRVQTQTIGQNPRLLGWLFLYLVVTTGLLWASLALTGHLRLLGQLAVIPAVVSGTLFAAQLERSRR